MPPKKKNSEADKTLQATCSVCTAPAAVHLHYGAICCYSCRAFFRRGLPKQEHCIYGEELQCVLNKFNRTNCKLCRYQRCIEVGMLPDQVDASIVKRKDREVSPNRCPASATIQEECHSEPSWKELDTLHPSPKTNTWVHNQPTNETMEEQKPEFDGRARGARGPLWSPALLHPPWNPQLFYPPLPLYSPSPIYTPDATYALQAPFTGRPYPSYPAMVHPPFHNLQSVSKDRLSQTIPDTGLPSRPWLHETVNILKVARELHEIKTETVESTVVEEEVIIDTLNDIIGDMDSAKVFTPKKRFMERDEQEEEECTEEDIEPIQIQVPLKKRQRMKEVPYSVNHAICSDFNPVMSFTFEEEFQVVDYKVRIEEYQNKRFDFLHKNFPPYADINLAFITCTQAGKKIPFNSSMDSELFSMGLDFTKKHTRQIFQEMGELSTDVRKEVLDSTYRALYVVFFSILEGNTREKTWREQHRKTLHTTLQNHSRLEDLITPLKDVRSISIKDQERFISPWAASREDEVVFERTVAMVGRLLRDDIQLQALYHMLVMMTPSSKTPEQIQHDPILKQIQVKLVQLIYRYLSTSKRSVQDDDKSDGKESAFSVMHLSDDLRDLTADEKTTLLISLIDGLHRCAESMESCFRKHTMS